MNFNTTFSFRNNVKAICRILIIPLVLYFTCTANASAQTIKLGSVAPLNSTWDLVLRGVAADWARISNGKVQLKIFSGGIAGSEDDMIRKMRIGQLQASAMGAMNLSEVYSGVLALGTPMLIRTNQEMTAMIEKISPFLDQKLEERGFVSLMWAPLGWVHFFSRKPVYTMEDLRQQRLWIGSSTPSEVRVWQRAGFDVVTLPTNEIATALQSGMIDAYLTSPLAAAAFQWFGLTPNLNDLRFAPLFGTVIIHKRAWKRIPESLQPRLRAAARTAAKRLSETSHEQDELAVLLMKAHGLKVVRASVGFEQDWKRTTDVHFQALIGDVIDPEAYKLVNIELAKFRARTLPGN